MHISLSVLPKPFIEDEGLAAASSATLLITAATSQQAEMVARRVHAAGAGAVFPFVRVDSVNLPSEPHLLRATCIDSLAAAARGTLFLCDVEKMPAEVQNHFFGLLTGLQLSRRRSKVRVVAGTTVALLDRIAQGTFCEHLFYRLNSIHLIAGREDGPRR
jgi:DNA-binding NtrC family response regulator